LLFVIAIVFMDILSCS